jgi:rubrerythrin
MELDTVDKILDFAIGQEENAARVYTDLAGRMEHQHMKDIFLGFAEEEKGHKEKLLTVKAGKQMVSCAERVMDLKIGDYLQDVGLSSNLSFQDALIVAMKAEKAAFRLYQDLASATDDMKLKSVLLGLAQEEAKHKLRFELEYDDVFLKEA